GDHLTPASAGLRQQWLGGLGDGPRQRELNRLAEAIEQWWQQRGGIRSAAAAAN
ncbi:MAG TPA: alpha/beta hydrolase, partial [Synechococcus sp. UBA9887]|nr:alpha/beta hydrolase [Synechococcus sp. UBA9887]